MMHDHGKSDIAIVAVKPTNKAGATGCGVGGAKGGGQGECASAKHGPGTVAGEPCHKRWSAYGKPQGKGRRRSSPRSSTTSALTISQRHSSELKETAAPGVDGLTCRDLRAAP